MRSDYELDADVFEFHCFGGAARCDGSFDVGMLGHDIESCLLVVDDHNSRIGQKLGIDIFLLGPEYCIDVDMIVEQAESQVPQRACLCFVCTGTETCIQRWIGPAANVGWIASLFDDNI